MSINQPRPDYHQTESRLQYIQKHTRHIWGGLAFSAILAMAYAFYTQYRGGIEPCNFCMLQRGSMIAVGTIALLAFIHNPKKTGQVIYGILADLAAISGIILAGRHVWLQHLPADKVPACGPPFDYLVSQFPIADVLQEIFSGSGDCAKIEWQFLGFSMPEIVLAVFIAMAITAQFLIFLALWQPKKTS